jgi:predicted DsbA family dithiol-disulfide isomerase
MKVEIWSDLACPWCYIGKRRFEKGLSAFEHKYQVQVLWRSFELNPNIPRGEVTSIAEFLSKHKGISEAAAHSMFAGVTSVAAGEGLNFNLKGGFHSNSSDAHRLVKFAFQTDPEKGNAMKDRLFSAYFEKAEKIGDVNTLIQIGKEVLRVDEEALRSLLASDSFADEVKADQVLGKKLGVTGVPYFLINGKHSMSGAESPEAFTRFFQKAWKDEMGQK